MNNVFDLLKDCPTHIRVPDYNYIVPMDVRTRDDLVHTNDLCPRYREQWKLSFTLQQTYWATQAEHNQARRFALDAVADSLYSNVRIEVHKALLAIESGDRIAAIAAILHIEDVTRPNYEVI